MFSCTATSVSELIAPYSKGKVLVLLEAVDPVVCDQMDHFFSLFKKLGLSAKSIAVFENFLEHGLLAIYAEISNTSKNEAVGLIDYFRQAEFKNAIRATLFIDEQFVEGTGQINSSQVDAYARFSENV